MEELGRDHELNDLKAHEPHQHDPLPPAVDYSQVTPSARYQFRALARRALSYHRRQRFTSICCLVIWPVLLVVLCLAFTLIGGGDSKAYNRVAFCVNEVDPTTSPDFSLDGIPTPKDGSSEVKAAWYPASFYSSYNTDTLPCVRWFGESYPIKAPYENTTAADAAEPSSYYTPGPPGGWFKLREYQDAYRKSRRGSDEPAIWSMPLINQTIFYTTANPQVAQQLGTVPNVTHSFFSETWPPGANVVWNASAPGVHPGTGLLGAIPVRYANGLAQTINTTAPSRNGFDNTIYAMQYMAQTFTPRPDQAALDQAVVELIEKYASMDRNINTMPWGAVSFDAIDPAKSSIKMTMQYGQPSLGEYTSNRATPPGLRQLITMAQMTGAMVKNKYPGQFRISQGLRALPYTWDSSILKGSLLTEMSYRLFPFGLSFLLPTFVALMVKEKEDRHRMMMAMNGLKPVSYYLAHYVEFVTMQMILSLFFCLTCAAISSQLILRTSPLLIIIILLVWAHTQATMAFFISACFSKTRRATLIVYFIVAISCIMAAIADQLFKENGVPVAWFIHPSFAFFQILSSGILYASRRNGLYPLIWADFAPGTKLFACLIMMLGESVLLVLLTFYIDAVAPSEYGVQKPWHFPITALFKKKAASRDPESRLSSHHDSAGNDLLEGGDADVYAERDRVRTQYDPSKTPLIIDGLFHRYRGKVEPALRGMSFGVENNTVLGLLGPNGAGKSTLIHLLTGLYSPTSGTAYVAGANIRTDMAIVHSKIGVCPQHDILWEDLTVGDHLLFYSRLRGIPPSLEQQAVDFAIASVSLTKFRDRQIVGLSGGEKRRVSIAIALLGDNSVIFLDEPSTGLDPAVRRVIWDIINRVKVNKTVVLTTHSMEEADILSDRIAIMTLGRLRCIGTSLHLKELYGAGFRLDISSKPGRLDEACQSVERQVLRGMSFRRIDKFTNATTYEFHLQQQQGPEAQARGQLSKVFSELSQPGRFPAVEDWGVSQTTLEDVFIKIVTEGDAALAMPGIVSA
ncbi:hypothetical protein BGZ72_000576 [Mortierella alpina]|nr:hypothetical protein BGZ72_000576 [Mortierella alpina]